VVPPPPPQPIPARPTKITSSPTIASQLRRRLGKPKKSRKARVAPPADGQNSFFISFFEVVAAVVEMVSVLVCAPELIVTEAGDKLHVAGSVAALVVNEQVRATAPVNPPDGVTLIVEVLPLAAPASTEILPLLDSAYDGVAAAVTVTFTTVVCVIAPYTPVTVTW
jgi:hypothetical protein